MLGHWRLMSEVGLTQLPLPLGLLHEVFGTSIQGVTIGMCWETMLFHRKVAVELGVRGGCNHIICTIMSSTCQ